MDGPTCPCGEFLPAALRLGVLDTGQGKATLVCHQEQVSGVPAPCPLCGQMESR